MAGSFSDHGSAPQIPPDSFTGPRGERPQSTEASPPVTGIGSHFRVLLVEDNAEAVTLLRGSLSKAGAISFTVTHVERLSEALERLNEAQFDVVLLDLTLPDSSGLDTLAPFYADHPQLPVLVVSEQDDEELAVQVAQRGAEDYLVKSWTRDDLLVRYIRCAIERKRLEEERARLYRQGEAERAFLREVLHQMVKGVIIADAPSGRFILGNENVAEIWRHPFIPAASVEEYALYRGFHSDGTPYSAREWPLARSVTSGETVTDEEIDFLRGDGTMGVMSVSSAPVRDAQGTIIAAVVTFYDITERKEMENALRESRERMHALSQRLIVAQEEERRHIARELHDQIGQALTALKLDLQAVQRAPDALLLASRLQESIQMLEQTLNQVRDLSFDLRPSLLDDLGLVSALRWYVDRWEQHTGIKTHFEAKGFQEADLRLPPNLDIVCFRIVQEALTNVLRHAQARRVDVTVRLHEGRFELEVSDDGVGFDVEKTLRRRAPEASLGLLGMQERVELMDGHLTTESEPMRGTRIVARFSLQEQAASAREAKGDQR
jgi:two-component system sensor histidine kinase UhpB